MKKLIMAAAAIAMMATTACNKTVENTEAPSIEERFQVSEAVGDSISQIYGQMVGGYILADYQNFSDESKNDQMKQDLIKGIRIALSEGKGNGVMMGLQVGMRMAQELASLEEAGVKVDREAVLKNFMRAFQADSVNMEDIRALQGLYTGLMQQVRNVEEAREEARIAESPEAQQNAISCKAFFDKLKTQEGIKFTESGLAYTISVPGDTTTISNNTLVTLNYVGKLIDGTVFDQSREDQPAKMSPAGVIPGFGEGLRLLGKGAKATFYIP
ncbi:MAG: FKBP-type peptidyl-prolyl cis-trans isomerase N-terminal domain-containing protein, partial [Muribaculaceae bacterium]